MLEVTKEKVEKKLKDLGISLNFSIELSSKESTTDKTKSIVYLNLKEVGYSGFAFPSLEHLLLHEIGHLYFWNFIPKKITSGKSFQEIFGEVYKFYRRDLSFEGELSNFISKYAQTHPRENFAEIFAVYAFLEGDMKKIAAFLKKRKKDETVLNQFNWLDNFVKKKS